MNRNWKNLILCLLPIAIPAGIALSWVFRVGDLPDEDYWNILAGIVKDGRFSTDLSDWLRSSEHLLVIPKLIYALNIIITHGTNTSLALVPWFAALLQVVMLLFCVPDEMRNQRFYGSLVALVIASFLFTPKAAHNWMLPVSGTVWMTANLFCVLSMFMLCRFQKSGKERLFWMAIAAGFFGFLSSSTSLALWPSLLIGSILLGFRFRHLLTVFFSALLLAFIFLTNFHRPSYHPEFERSVLRIGEFVLQYTGGLFAFASTHIPIATVTGLFGIVASVVLISFISRTQVNWRIDYAPWLMLQVYGLTNALLAAVARGGFGETAAIQSRYASLPAFFWVGLGVMSLLYFWRSERLRPYFWAPVTILLVLVLAMHVVTKDYLNWLFARAERKKVAVVSMLTGIVDEGILRETVHRYFRELKSLEWPETIKHVPYDKWPEGWPTIGSRLEFKNAKDGQGDSEMLGNFETIISLGPSKAAVKGWAYALDGKIRSVAVVNESGVVRGIASPGLTRRDVAAVHGRRARKTGWEGYTHIVDGDQLLSAVALVGQPGHWVQIPNVHKPPP